MYFCKNCGRLAHPGEDRCPKCGAAHIQPTPAAAAPTGPAAPQYHPAEDAPEQDVPALGFGSTLGTLVIFAIPLVGFIMMLVWSFPAARTVPASAWPVLIWSARSSSRLSLHCCF